jgi:hypothetical protein
LHDMVNPPMDYRIATEKFACFLSQSLSLCGTSPPDLRVTSFNRPMRVPRLPFVFQTSAPEYCEAK